MKKSFRKLGKTTALTLSMVGTMVGAMLTFTACGDDDEDSQMGDKEDESTEVENKGQYDNLIQTKGEYLGIYYKYKRIYNPVVEENGRYFSEETFDINGNEYAYESNKYIKVMKVTDNKYVFMWTSYLGNENEDNTSGSWGKGSGYFINKSSMELNKEYYVDRDYNYKYYIKVTSDSTLEFIRREPVEDRIDYYKKIE